MITHQKTHVIYISGFGDGYDGVRHFLLGLWRYRNVTAELVPMRWSVDEPFETKRQRVFEAIDAAKAQNKRVVLVGESAGGSMAVNVYAARTKDIARVVTLCGKNTAPESVAPRFYRKNPAFRTSMNELNASIKSLSTNARQRFTTIYPLYDPVVPIQETMLDGCRKVKILAVGHIIPILLCLSLFSPIVIREARRND